jgi:WD40 repeat protein
VVTASRDKTARIWDARTGTAFATLRGHEDRVVAAAFSSDGTRVVTASVDHTARIWDVPTVLRAEPKDQVRLACEHLKRMHAPLAFTKADMQTYPVLQGEPLDPATGDFVSPCKGVLPKEAFAKPLP